MRLSYVKVAELQARAIPHFHALIRLDDATSPTDVPAPPLAGVDAGELVGLIVQAAASSACASRRPPARRGAVR